MNDIRPGEQGGEKPPGADVAVAVLGAGFAGVGMAIRLKQAGIDSFLVLEREDAIGGTWWLNRYPGCACDVPSPLYSFSFAPNPSWSRVFGPRHEIQEYIQACAARFGIEPHVRLGAEVTGLAFDEDEGLWSVEVNGGEVVRARAVVSCLGGLSRPAYPEIRGMDSFRGITFHTQEWDEDAELEGKAVALIGTGASAVQVMPRLARRVEGLYLFQRTPPWILPRPDRRFTRLERSLFARVPVIQNAYRKAIYWSLETLVLIYTRAVRAVALLELVARAQLRLQVRDRKLRHALTPNYRLGCKRVLYANDYYPALQRDNVELVTDRIARITERGVVTADGRERAVDAILYATGFRIGDPPSFRVVGRNGRSIHDNWRDRVEGYLGVSVAGFPNLFYTSGPNSGIGHTSFLFMLEAQIDFIVKALRAMDERSLRWVDVRPAAQAEFNRELRRKLERSVWASGCHSYYLDANGNNTVLWPGFSFEYRLRTRRFREEDYELAPVAAPPPSAGERTGAVTASSR